jgi:hypothetical protein
MREKFIFQNSDTAKIRYRADAASRIDYAPVASKFEKTTIGNTANLGAGFFKNQTVF